MRQRRRSSGGGILHVGDTVNTPVIRASRNYAFVLSSIDLDSLCFVHKMKWTCSNNHGHLQVMLSHMSQSIRISAASDQGTTDLGVASTYGSI